MKEGCVQQNGMKLSLLTSHLSATPRWSDSSLETPWRDDAVQLRYAPPHWSCTGATSLRCWSQLSVFTFQGCPSLPCLPNPQTVVAWGETAVCGCGKRQSTEVQW
ncbi:hypothetical protein TNCV_976881 [Trichonephila clavipes]|nr:hypothetical protein TNCV_976881 [Trichonephila clavipes]